MSASDEKRKEKAGSGMTYPEDPKEGGGGDEGNRRSHHHHHSDERTQITVNVNVECCPRPVCPGGKAAPPGRPTHQTGTSDGSGPGGLDAPGAIIKIPQRPPNVWPGPRTTLYSLPLLFIRATAGDTGARPVVGTFWESPDIFIAPGVAPDAAPPLPSDLGGVAQANADNTIYAHVWNLGQGPAIQALVEFYVFNPSLAFTGGNQLFFAFTTVDLEARFGGRNSHKVVKCPLSWRAAYENGGHECVVVRVSNYPKDPLSGPAWDASQNRHIGQRNIHVMTAAEAAAKPTIGIDIGPLFDAPALVTVDRADAATMPWLHLATNSRTVLPGTGVPTGDVGISPPMPSGITLPNLGAIPNPRGAGLIADSHGVTGDQMQVGFVTTDGNPGAGNAHVYRVSGSQNGQRFGGYTVVILGS
jgi:hypothetical protein